MEKHAERRIVIRCSGLLIILCEKGIFFLVTLFLFCLGQKGFSASSHASYLSSLSFKCQDDYVFSATNTVFAVDIAYLPPEDISVYLNSIPNNVELVSIKKVTYIPPSSSKQGYGTHVEITVRFSSTGDVKLFAADLETKEGFFKIPFQRVHVWANMQILKPELSVSIEGIEKEADRVSCSVASHLRYTVRVKYVSAVRSISYEIPENSIFIEKERFMDPEAEDAVPGDFSPDFQDAVCYDWQPLVSGDYELPAIKLVVQAYNGNLVSLPFPTIVVHVDDKDIVSAAQSMQKPPAYFSSAFEEFSAEQTSLKNNGSVEVSTDKAQQLANLYVRERSSFPFFRSVMEERKKFETVLGHEVLPPIPRRPVFIMLLLFCGIALFISILFIWRKFFARAAFSFFITLFLAILSLIYGVRLSRKYAVSKGGELYPIPESAVVQGGELPVASVVSILKKAGDWYYVSFNDTNGWIPSNAVILIP